MTLRIVAFSTLLVMLAHPAWPQQRVWITNQTIQMTIGQMSIRVERDNRPDAHLAQFTVLARQTRDGTRGDFRGVCSESLSVELVLGPTAQYDEEPYLESRSGADLPIAETLNALKDALLEQCYQLQVIRVRAKSYGRADRIRYRGTMTRADGWQLQDGVLSTEYDASHWFIFDYRHPTSVGGVRHDGVCEEEPVLLLEARPSRAQQAIGFKFSVVQAVIVAQSAAARYAEECPGTKRISFIVAPLEKSRRCIEGKECYVVAVWNEETGVWDADDSQFEYVDLVGPINGVGDIEEVLAAGEFHLLSYGRAYHALYFESFINAYSDHCRSYIQTPVSYTYPATPGTKWVDGFGNVTGEMPGLPARTITIDAGYRQALNRHKGAWVKWMASNLSMEQVDGMKRYVLQSVAGNCEDDRIQTIYKNMYNLANQEPAIKGKYATNIKPLEVRQAYYSSAPEKSDAIIAERKRRERMITARLKQEKAARREAWKTAPPPERPVNRAPQTIIDLDHVVSKMARTAGRLQATAEQCSGEPEPEIRATFIEAGSIMFPDDVAAIEQAFDQHYEDRKAKLASRKKDRCREKDRNRWSQENELNLELLADDGAS